MIPKDKMRAPLCCVRFGRPVSLAAAPHSRSRLQAVARRICSNLIAILPRFIVRHESLTQETRARRSSSAEAKKAGLRCTTRGRGKPVWLQMKNGPGPGAIAAHRHGRLPDDEQTGR